MGKSPNACFKIISCGADSADIDDDLLPPESKQSSDKRRWSFRKKSARHQVPSNTAISEPLVVGFDKENAEATTDNYSPVKDSSVPEKSLAKEQADMVAPLASAVVYTEEIPSIEQSTETAPLSSAVVNLDKPPVTEQVNEIGSFTPVIINSEEIVEPDDGKVIYTIEANLQEKAAVAIQAAARRFMAQRELQKLKSVVRLQAAVRGHLVRKQAIGTLRCVQAIAKMQILVRARRARQCTINEEIQNDLVKRNSDLKSKQTNSTVQKLLSNGFAHQLLKSTQKSKPVHISCDPSRHDSAWQWLERWMAVTTSKVGQQEELNCSLGHQEERENYSSLHEELVVDAAFCASKLFGPKLSPGCLPAAASQWDCKIDMVGKLESQAPSIVSDQCVSSSTEGGKEHSQGEDDIAMSESNFGQIVSAKEKPVSCLQSAYRNYPNNIDPDGGNLTHATKPDASYPVETEGKKFDLGSKKSRNPAFAAVQAKFEELSSAPKSIKSVSISRDAALESKANNSQALSVTKNKDSLSMDNSTTQNPILQVAPSECGTEISISSTLDSPDRSETDGGEIILEIETSGQETHNVNGGASKAFDLANIKHEAVSPTSIAFKGQRPNNDDESMANPVTSADPVDMVEPPVETVTSRDWHQQENFETPARRSSPEGSPRNHATASEAHDTPSSQVSVQSRASKSQNDNPARKPKSKAGTKSLSSNGKNDSDERSSAEQLPKVAKNVNKRTSFGMSKLDLTDNEPRRSSSNLLPSYMQATESARAKAQGSVSLKSSPDVHEKENHTKKRHSLPITDEKQGSSPRVQRSASQTHQSSKRNNNHSPQSSAERRWQR